MLRRGKKVASIAWFMIGMAVIMFGLGAGKPPHQEPSDQINLDSWQLHAALLRERLQAC